MKVCICCIGRMENRYINEFISHYLKIGVDKIFIYDNNYDDEEYFEDVIPNELLNKQVEIINFRNMSYCQLKAYQDCYDKHNKEYDWMLFIDCDEFLHIEKFDNIKNFVNQEKFNNFALIHINWMVFDDNNQIKYEEKSLQERFPSPKMPLNWVKTHPISENCLIKTLIRGNLSQIKWSNTPHTPISNYRCCNPSGIEVNSNHFLNPIDFDYAYLKHYTTKTIEEWLDIKTKRGFPDGNKDHFKKVNIIDEFFKTNEKTEEKINFIKERGLKHLL